MTARRTPSVRTVFLGMAAVAGLYVAALGAYVVFELLQTATALRSRTEAFAQTYDSLRTQADRTRRMLATVRELSAQPAPPAEATAQVRALTDTVNAMAQRTLAVQAGVLLSGIPQAMRVALANVANDESNAAGRLLEALHDLAEGDRASAGTWLVRADSAQSRLGADLDEAQRLGLADLADWERVLSERAAQVGRGIVAWLLLGGGLVVVAVLVFRGRLHGPLFMLDRAFARVAQGDLQASLPVVRTDEMGRLAEHFNEMTAVLRSRPEVEALRQSEERFRTLIEHGSDIIAILDAEARIIYHSPAVSRVLGHSAADLVGTSVFERIHPDDAGKVREALEQVLRTGREARVVSRARHRDGDWRWLESVISNALSEPSVAGLVVNARDITEERRAEKELGDSEARFRAAFMTVADAHFIATKTEGQIVEINERFVELFGWSREEVIGRTTVELPLYQVSGDRARMLAELDARGHVRDLEIVARCKDGTTIPVLLSVREFASRDETLILGVIRDVSELRRTRERLRSLEEQFRQAQRLEAIGRLAGGVAHDFNNLLTVVSASSDMLLEALAPDDPKREEVEHIRTAARRATVLTRQLLALGRRQVMQPRVLDLNDVVRDVERLLPRLIGEDVRVDFRLDDRLGAVRADPGQIEQVLVNLAINARDAMPGGGYLTIETANALLDEAYASDHAGVVAGPHVMLLMRDTGIGMDEATRTHIFEPFFTTKDASKGTGLGLSTVHGIVSQSDGTITVESAPGEGTTIRIYFPRVDAPVTAPTPERPTEVVSGGETILLVEDEPSVRRAALRALQIHGYDVLAADGGSAALAVAREHPGRIHLLVTDLVMPGMSGRDLATTLAAERPDMRLLFMSGYTDDADMRRDVRDNGAAFLAKPYSPQELGAKVREVLDRA